MQRAPYAGSDASARVMSGGAMPSPHPDYPSPLPPFLHISPAAPATAPQPSPPQPSQPAAPAPAHLAPLAAAASAIAPGVTAAAAARSSGSGGCSSIRGSGNHGCSSSSAGRARGELQQQKASSSCKRSEERGFDPRSGVRGWPGAPGPVGPLPGVGQPAIMAIPWPSTRASTYPPSSSPAPAAPGVPAASAAPAARAP
jgi:hypothetical protein